MFNYLVSPRELEEDTSLKGQNCFIIATSQASMNFLLWTTFSLLLRSKSFADHFIFSINGPDARTGDPWLQDTKQKFLEVLRDQYQGNITINRVWSRIGHSQSLESAIPWVHTEYYTLAHDDIILLDPEWGIKCREKFEANPNLAICAAPPLIRGGDQYTYDGVLKLGMPHINSTLVTCRKSLTTTCGARWWGHHLKKKFRLTDDIYSRLMKDFGDCFTDKYRPLLGTEYGIFSSDIGGTMLHSLRRLGYDFAEMDESTLIHFIAASWAPHCMETRKQDNYLYIRELEEEINNSRFAKIFNDFKEDWD